jgi:hypothetical protein
MPDGWEGARDDEIFLPDTYVFVKIFRRQTLSDGLFLVGWHFATLNAK